ncbi:MAG: beta-galactosidase, partial [Oscillospiraceae bacterium]|nr:beta-galactosidase [Oscillospiraceae bacterium]
MQPFEITQGKFLLHGEDFPLYSGAMHYFRTVPQDWRDRLSKLKAAGLNTVETYVCWNLHEPQPGKFDFSGMLDIAEFLRIAQELGLWAIVRPGPYICSEWDLGGLPPWLLKDPGMRLRVAYPPYLERVKIFYENFLPQIAPLQITRGGNVIMVQVENEYGSYANDHEYLAFCKQCLLDGGIDVPLFTSDGGWESALTGGKMPGVLATANFGSRAKQNFDVLRKYEPEGPWVCCEFWNGWFDHWGAGHHARDSKEVVDCLNEIFDDGGHVNFYMFHGGTNFGFTAGANFREEYSPTVTSYDDDAPLNEYGGYTPKYHAIRKVLLERQGIDPADLPLPAEAPLQHVGNVALTEQALLFAQLDNIATHHKSV